MGNDTGVFPLCYYDNAWTYQLQVELRSTGVVSTQTFHFWLSDAEDDDDGDDLPGGSDSNDEDGGTGTPIVDGYSYYGIADTHWGSYGSPAIYPANPALVDEFVPGCQNGQDYYGAYGANSIMYEQLKKAYNATLARMKEQSTQLPPLIPDDSVHGQPSISAKIFGPQKPATISFRMLENRKSTVYLTVTASNSPIKSKTSGKIWDGGANADCTLASNGAADQLPWRLDANVAWDGTIDTGDLMADGQHTIRIKVRDVDGNHSEERTRTVKYDKTVPTGTIMVNGK